jgi:hypothetical protein
VGSLREMECVRDWLQSRSRIAKRKSPTGRERLRIGPSRSLSHGMSGIIDNPFTVFFLLFFAQWGAANLGDFLRRTLRPLRQNERTDFDTVLTATLTLLALIIGFSFSIAVNDYIQRKNNEAAEASAIGTAYVRADLLPGDDGAKVRGLLSRYVALRILFYRGDVTESNANATEMHKLQAELWSSVLHAANTQPTPVTALVVVGMNDVLNSEGFAQAAWQYRIPAAAWMLMGLMAIVSNLLLGYRERSARSLVLVVFPLIAAIAFFLIADIDSTTKGIIRVVPLNLIAVSQSMQAH